MARNGAWNVFQNPPPTFIIIIILREQKHEYHSSLQIRNIFNFFNPLPLQSPISRKILKLFPIYPPNSFLNIYVNQATLLTTNSFVESFQPLVRTRIKRFEDNYPTLLLNTLQPPFSNIIKPSYSILILTSTKRSQARLYN